MTVLAYLLASPLATFFLGLFVGGLIAGYRADQRRRRDANFFDWR